VQAGAFVFSRHSPASQEPAKEHKPSTSQVTVIFSASREKSGYRQTGTTCDLDKGRAEWQWQNLNSKAFVAH
jgi:hypothetical protein